MEAELFKRAARETLRYAVMRQIECPGCARILDAAESVYVDQTDGERVTASLVVCAACWARPPMFGVFASVCVFDGRVLFGDKRKRATAWRVR